MYLALFYGFVTASVLCAGGAVLLARQWFVRRRPGPQPGLCDLLPYAAVLGERVIALKCGALAALYELFPADLSCREEPGVEQCRRLAAAAAAHLDQGWSLQIDCVCREDGGYLPTVAAATPAAVRAFERDRADACRARPSLSRHYLLTLVKICSKAQLRRLQALLTVPGGAAAAALAADFTAQLKPLEQSLELIYGLKPLRIYTRDDTAYHPALSWISTCLTGRRHPVALPRSPVYPDRLLSTADFTPGLTPSVGDEAVACVAVDTFPGSLAARALEDLDTLGFPYRFSTRFIRYNSLHAERRLRKTRRFWAQKTRHFTAQLTANEAAPLNQNAVRQTADTDEALRALQSGDTVFGAYTAVVVLRHPEIEILEARAAQTVKILEQAGFCARVESHNATEAFLGSLPGGVTYNRRRPMISSDMLSCLLPLHAAWGGEARAPNPLFGTDLPPLLQGRTDGGARYFVNLHVSDLGNTLVAGPPGTGKSVLLGALAMALLRYQGMRVYAFDRDWGFYGWCRAVGGLHIDLGADIPALSPLSPLQSDADLQYAVDYLGHLCRLNELPADPTRRERLLAAVRALRGREQITLSDLCLLLPEPQLRSVVGAYTVAGGEAVLDAPANLHLAAPACVFECAELFRRPARFKEPVLRQIFRLIERDCDGSHPGAIILDEAWAMLDEPQFAAQLLAWFKTLRKANVCVILATQSLADFTAGPWWSNLLDCVKTRILLPNADALSAHQSPLYAQLGLQTGHIERIAAGRPKRDYFLHAGDHFSTFSLCAGAAELKLLSQCGPEGRARIDAALARDGADFFRNL